jgi:type IV pilus assembly protein PilB
MDNQTLLQALVENNLLSQEDADKLIQDSASLRQSAEELIYERRLVDEVEVAKVKSRILQIPFKRIDPETIKPELLKSIPANVAKTYKIIPISRTAELLVVGMLDPEDQRAKDALVFVAKKEKVSLGIYLITPSDLDAVLRKYSSFQEDVEAAIQSLGLGAGKRRRADQSIQLEEGTAIVEDAPIIRIVAAVLTEAVNIRASDIHIEPQRTRLRIRFRISGDLQEVKETPIELHQPIVSRIKVLSNMKLDENRVPQDGRFRSVVFGRDIDFRVATLPTPAGEKVVIRVLDPELGLKKLDELGFVGKTLDVITGGIEKPFGMVLMTGPTGSGKTTTLYALLQILNTPDVNIVSLEDPVEYYVDGTNQSQVRPEIGYDFAAGLRQILRQDPDVIMVGEIRDAETASLAVQAALTGHIVLSTLHTNNAIGVIPRLLDMKVDSFLLPAALNVMAAQRLVGRLCDKCKKAEAPPDNVKKIIDEEIAKLAPDIKAKLKIKEPYRIYHSPGCAACKQKGIVGRLAIAEAFQMTPQLSEIINVGFSETKIVEEAKRQGMVTMRQDGILKALDGLVSVEEVLRETAEL